jgi:pimeloyl-ACP methyl ester carboxylesterase
MRVPTGALSLALCLLATGACRQPAPTGSAPVAAGPRAAGRPLPETIDLRSRYVVYLHGAIVEGDDPRPISPEFGPYEFEAILRAFEARGFVVVAHQRPAQASPEAWAERTAGDVRSLLDAGVPGSRITVVGASKGGAIALLAAARLGRPELRFVVLGACSPALVGLGLRPAGRILSIREGSDPIGGSCEPLLAASPDAAGHREIVLDTGLRHGFLFAPRPEWLDPAVAWAEAP